MVWQDILIMIVNILFGYSLIPQVAQGFRDQKGYINLQTALITTIGMFTLTFAFFTLNLYLSTIISVFNSTMWLVLLVQKIIYK